MQLYGVLDQRDATGKEQSILVLSRGTAIILLFLYVVYLIFQLRTHSNLFDAEGQFEDAEEAEEASMGPIAAAVILVLTTILVAICADYLVGSIDDIVESAGISKAFIGLILIPIVGNAAEHVTAVVVAIRNKMDLAMGVAIGSSIQIALGVTPFLVIVGWAIGQPMTLHFETCKFAPYSFDINALTMFSRNCCFRRLRARRDLHCPGRQVQLSRGRHAPGALHYYRCCFLRHPQWRPG